MVSSERMTLTPSVTMSSASQRTSAWRMVNSIAGPSTSLLGSNTRLNSPQPNVGWLTRSPGAVNRTWMILPRIASSPPLATMRPPASIARGNPKVVMVSAMDSSDQHGAHGDDLSHGEIGGVVAGLGRVAVARRLLAVYFHRRAAHLDRPLVLRRILKRGARGRDVWGRIVCRAAHRRGRLAHDLYIGTQPAVDDPGERERHR